MTTSEVLNKAADLIMEKGHHKGGLYGPGGSVCIEAACIEAACGDIPVTPLYALLGKVVGRYPVYQWNDLPETTEAMVLGALHEAAILAKEQGD